MSRKTRSVVIDFALVVPAYLVAVVVYHAAVLRQPLGVFSPVYLTSLRAWLAIVAYGCLSIGLFEFFGVYESKASPSLKRKVVALFIGDSFCLLLLTSCLYVFRLVDYSRYTLALLFALYFLGLVVHHAVTHKPANVASSAIDSGMLGNLIDAVDPGAVAPDAASRHSISDLSLDGALQGNDQLGKLQGIEDRIVYRVVKRLFDVAFSIVIIVAFCWVFLLVALAIKCDDGGPVLFKQERVGKNGKLFTMYKFRSMCVDAEDKLESLRDLNEKDGPVFKIGRDPRVTRCGHWLRKLSLDELPQFFNTLKGDISVVGPRPALPREVEQYNEYQRQRLLVKPGITCYWQTRVNRDAISFDEWVDLDLLYIRQCSVWTDFKLILQTVGVVLTAQGS